MDSGTQLISLHCLHYLSYHANNVRKSTFPQYRKYDSHSTVKQGQFGGHAVANPPFPVSSTLIVDYGWSVHVSSLQIGLQITEMRMLLVLTLLASLLSLAATRKCLSGSGAHADCNKCN